MGMHFAVQKDVACTSNASKTRLPVYLMQQFWFSCGEYIGVKRI